MRVALSVSICYKNGKCIVEPRWINPPKKPKPFVLKGECCVALPLGKNVLQSVVKLPGKKPSRLIIKLITKREAIEYVKNYKIEKTIVAAAPKPIYLVTVELTEGKTYRFITLNIEIDELLLKELLRTGVQLVSS